MASETFREKVEQKLKNLDGDQVMQFAWRCAVRALPFLAKDGNFNFWKDKDKQKHIYAVLYAIDFASADADAYTASTSAVVVASAAFDAASTYAFSSASDAAYGAGSVAAYAATAYADVVGKPNSESIILQDIKSISGGGANYFNRSIW